MPRSSAKYAKAPVEWRRSSRATSCDAASPRDEQGLGEWPLAIEPLAGAREPGAFPEPERLVELVLVRALGPDRLAGAQVDHEVQRADRDGLLTARHEVHLDVALGFVPARRVFELAQLEGAAQLAVEAGEQ